MNRSWVIKLGSGGQCVPFCEQHQIVGVGWRDVDVDVVNSGTREQLVEHVRATCKWYGKEREIGAAAGQLYRFGRECTIGDYILYYDPPKKHVRICRVASEVRRRNFAIPEQENVDIWLYRAVEYIGLPIPILDFYGALKGKVLGPRMSFWELHGHQLVEQLVKGDPQQPLGARDEELDAAFAHLRTLLLRRAEALNERDWEWLVVDYFKAQGAYVDERKVGGSHALIDAEARFDHGELGEELWRIQVKRYQDKQLGWDAIHPLLDKVGDARLCFVSVYGFTAEAREKAEEEEVYLMEAGDFTRFLLSGKVRESLRQKLKLPLFGGTELGSEVE